jgi:hypothetical protein
MFLIAPKCDNLLVFVSTPSLESRTSTSEKVSVRSPAPLGVFPSLPYYHIPSLFLWYVKYLKELEKIPYQCHSGRKTMLTQSIHCVNNSHSIYC